ncbi:MAG: ZIP family metal transporter [Armatimonadetes bacterium]|nr:ZIP family metal transporter [Armatimonadota bacterium]
MFESFSEWHPVVQALLAGLLTWGLTAFGASGVFLAKQPSRKLLDGMLAFAAGVMIAASYWSLLSPAIEMAAAGPLPSWLPPAVGFLLGGAVLYGVDKLLPHVHPGLATQDAEGIHTTWRRTTLLILAITLHNIPEGLAVGVAFGAAAAGLPEASLTGATALALGIGIQNCPEGLAVSMPLRREGISRRLSFFYGQLSAVVEPVSAVIGAAIVLVAQAILPYALAFAAGAMIFVVVEELIPESQNGGYRDVATGGVMIGFVVMMILDVALG